MCFLYFNSGLGCNPTMNWANRVQVEETPNDTSSSLGCLTISERRRLVSADDVKGILYEVG